LIIGGALKIAYDLLLYGAFRHVRPPEETTNQQRENVHAEAYCVAQLGRRRP
jgi:hypothetical protein